MCVILSVYQKTPKVNLALLQKIYELAINNPDGIGIVAFNTNNEKNLVQRRLKIENTELAEILNSYQVVNIHLRNSTAGVIAKKNVHFWRYDNWLFAHNGQVWNYEKYKSKCDEKMCDSFVLFEKLLTDGCLTEKNTINFQKMEKSIDEISFWGRFLITNLATKRNYYFGDFKAIMFDQNTLIISTQSLNFGMTINLMGIEFKTEIQKTLEQDMDGIFWFSPKKNKIFFQSHEFNESLSGYKGYKVYDCSNETSNYYGANGKLGNDNEDKIEMEKELDKLLSEETEKEKEIEKEMENTENTENTENGLKKIDKEEIEKRIPFPCGKKFTILE
jgi:predicted glutamine amidotransferase